MSAAKFPCSARTLPLWPEIPWLPPAVSSHQAFGPHELYVLGINPWIEDFAAYNVWLRPLGLLACLQAVAACGANTALLDCLEPTWRDVPWPVVKQGRGRFPRVELPPPAPLKDVPRTFARYGLPLEAVQGALARLQPPPNVVLVPCLMTYWYTGAQRVIRLVRDLFPGAVIILGGVYPSLCPEHAEAHSGADLVVSGPFEHPENWQRLWQALGHRAPEAPASAGFSLQVRAYAAPRHAPILGSRGCPFSCAYCASSTLYPGFSQRSFSEVREEFMLSYDKGVRDFAFFDDALLLRPETWLVPFLEHLTSLDVRLHAPNAMHARALTPELCALLRRAGLARVRLGVETLDCSHRSDAKLQAGELEAGLQALHEGGFQSEEIAAYVLCGLPGQKMQEVESTLVGLRRLGVRPLLSHYTPLPGSALFEAACAASPFDLQGEPLCQNNALWPCVPGGFSWERRGHLQALAYGSLGES